MIKAHPSSNIRARIGPRSRTAEGPKCDWPSELIPASRVRIVVGIFLTQLMGIQWWWRWWSKIHFGMEHRYPQIFFPTLTCGVFVFSAVSAPPSSRLSSHSHTHTSLVQHHSHTHPNHTHTPHTPHTHAHHTHTYIAHTHITFFLHIPHIHHTCTHTHSLAHISHTHGTWCTAKGSEVRPGVPPVSLTYTHIPHTPHTHTHNHKRTSQSHTHTSSHSHTHTSQSHTHTTHSHTYHPWSPPLCRCLLRGRRGTWCPLVSAALPVAFAWQAWDLVHCKGVGCTPWRPSGVPPVSLGLRRSAGGFCMAGVGLGTLQRGRMYALASLRCPSGVPWSPPLCRWLLRGRRGPWR